MPERNKKRYSVHDIDTKDAVGTEISVLSYCIPTSYSRYASVLRTGYRMYLGDVGFGSVSAGDRLGTRQMGTTLMAK